MTAVEIDAVVVNRPGGGHGPPWRRTAALTDPILDRITASIRHGRITGLLGPSGSGKTTLMRVLVGVQRIHAGAATVLGHPAGSAALRRRVGYLTQAPAIYQDLSVVENVRYFAALAGAGPAAVDQAMREAGLAGLAGQLSGTLSGGQRSRASLACALVGRPDLLVLDEPTVGQDPVLREELWGSFRARAAAGATVIVSSHVMDEAVRCDDLLLIRDGAILIGGTPAQVMDTAGTADLDSAFLALIRRKSATAEGNPAAAARSGNGAAAANR